MIKNWTAFNEANEIKKEGICICRQAPKGDSGLEGFNEDDEYKFELKTDKDGKAYYKIYHDEDYAETCGTKTFKKYFNIKNMNETFLIKDDFDKVKNCLIQNGINDESASKLTDVILGDKSENINKIILSLEKVSDLLSGMFGIYK